MQIRVTDVGLDALVDALGRNGFGLVKTTCEKRRQVETVSIFTEDTPTGPGGYDVGIIRREVASFARYEMVLETSWIGVPRLMALLEKIASA